MAAWPEWWSNEADSSVSAYAELKFSVARKLGLDPRSVLDEEQPTFIWDDSAKFKNYKSDDTNERAAITAFGRSLNRILSSGVQMVQPIPRITAGDLRASILKTQPYIRLIDLLGFLWAFGVPIIHLKVFPLSAKRMCAMSVRQDDNYAILLAKDDQYPASITFHVAHEIGHIMLGHLDKNVAVVDMDDPLLHHHADDPEEKAADEYALELLTGLKDPQFNIQGGGRLAKQLAAESRRVSEENHIEPGTLALCYGYKTTNWGTANKALEYIYERPQPVWENINRVASQQLNWETIQEDNGYFLRAVMGGI